MPLVGRQTVPAGCLQTIAAHATALLVHPAEVGLRKGEPLVSGLAEQPHGFLVVAAQLRQILVPGPRDTSVSRAVPGTRDQPGDALPLRRSPG